MKKICVIVVLLMCALPLAGCNRRAPEESFVLSIGQERYTPLGKSIEIHNRHEKDTYDPLDITDFSWLEALPRLPNQHISGFLRSITETLYDEDFKMIKQVTNNVIDLILPCGTYYVDMRITWGNEDEYITNQYVYKYKVF